jgi:hypothetical protein
VTEAARLLRLKHDRALGWIYSVRPRAVDTDQPRGSRPRCRVAWTGLAGLPDDSTRRPDAKVATRRQRDSQDAQRAKSPRQHAWCAVSGPRLSVTPEIGYNKAVYTLRRNRSSVAAS